MNINLNYYSKFCCWYSFLISSSVKDVSVVMNRTDDLFDVEAQIWKGKLYIAYHSSLDGDSLMENLEKQDPVYEEKMTIENFLSLQRSTKESFRIMEMTDTSYKWWAKFDDTGYGLRFSFIPTEWEMATFYVFNEKAERKTTVDWLEVTEIRTILKEAVQNSKARYSKREELDDNETRTLLTDMSHKTELTLRNMDTYLWNRHELFSRNCMVKMNLSSMSTDIQLKKFFSSVDFGIHNDRMTPDLIFDDGRRIHVVEFAISDSNDTNALRRKRLKYESCLMEISRQIGKPIDFSIVLLCTDREIRVYGSEQIRNEIGTEPDIELLEIMRAVERIPNYASTRELFNQIGEVDRMENKAEFFKNLRELEEIKWRNTVEFKTFSFDDSMNSDVMNSPYWFSLRETSDPMVSFSDLMSSVDKFDDSNFISEVYRNQTASIFTKEIQEMKDLKPADVVKEINEKMMELVDKVPKKIPKAFKIPAITRDMEEGYLPADMVITKTLADGSCLLRPEFGHFETPEKSETIGLPIDELLEFEESLKSYFEVKKKPYSSMVDMMKATKFYEIAEMTQTLVRELNLLANRRHINGAKRNSAIYKDYDHFSLLIANGPPLTANNQLIFRVFSCTETCTANNALFKSFYPSSFFGIHSANDCLKMTKWVSLQMADLEHYSTIAKRINVILSDMWEKTLETSPSSKRSLNTSEVPVIFQASSILMMEHKRNTSTLNQLSRYLMHSGTGVLSNYKKLAKEIFETPRWTIIQSWVVWKQCEWFKGMLMSDELVQEYIRGLLSGSPTRDRFTMKSLFSGQMVDFQLIMEEIYYCNLFNYKHGFKGHRDKAIVEKVLMIEEMYIDRVKEGSVFQTWKDVYYDKDEMCKINLSFMKRMVHKYLSKAENQEIVKMAASRSLEFGLSKILKMTRSVVAIKDDFEPFVEMSDNISKETVFEAVVHQIEALSEISLLEIVKREKEIFAVFSTFSKDQIGNAREILIQSIKTRICTAMMNNFFEFLCEAHPKDMTTKEGMKREKQSRTLLEMAEEVDRINTSRTKAAIMFSVNSDASKWAQAMLMPGYAVMISAMDSVLSNRMIKYFVAMYSAYANKIMYIPDSLLKKLSTWSDDMVDADEVITRVKAFCSETGMMIIHSGMGQGNFQHGSGFMHCLVDDMADYYMEAIFMLHGYTITSVALISSDDSTKMVMMTFSRTKEMISKLDKMIFSFADIFTGLRKMANIHINWKKTAIQMIITEFNSVFTILKRSYVASLKDCYNSVNIVDMTRPEEAVKEAISSISRLRDAGCYLKTIEMAMIEMREFLITSYNYSEEDIKWFCDTLECTADEIPFTLGFLPTTMAMETLTYGPEIMVAAAKSDALRLFYRNVYADSILSKTSSLEETPEIVCKATIELNYQKDLKLTKMKKDLFSNWGEVTEAETNHVFLNQYSNSLLIRDFKMYLKDYLVKVKKTYAFSSSFRYHTVIRAMQMSYNCRLVSMEYDDEGRTIRDMVRKILSTEIKTTFVSMFDILIPIVNEYQLTMESMKKMNKKRINRHPKFRTLTFFTRSVSDNVREVDLVRAIFSADSNIKSSMMYTIQDFAKMIEVDAVELTTEPFRTSKTRFGEKGLTVLINYIRWYCKFYSSKDVTMVSDYATSWDRESDMATWYYYKSNPEYIYSDEALDYMEDSRKLMENEIAFGSIENAVMHSVTKTRMRRRDMVLKMMSNANVTSEEKGKAMLTLKDYSLLESRPVFSKKRVSEKEIEMCYLDNLGKVILTEFESNKWLIKLYGRISNGLKSMVAREILKNDRISIGMKISYYVSRSEVYTCSAKDLLSDQVWSKIYTLLFTKPKMQITRTFGMWRADLISSNHQVNIFKGEKNFYPNMVSGKMSESIFSFKRMALNQMNYKEIHDLISTTFQMGSSFFTEGRRANPEDQGINTQVETMLVSSLMDGSTLGYIDDDEFEGMGIRPMENDDSDSEASEVMVENENIWEFSTLLSPEFVEEIVQMSISPDQDWASDCMAVNSLIMSAITVAVREEIKFSISKFSTSRISATELMTILANLISRDLFFDEKGDIDEFFSVLTSLAIIKMSSFSQRMLDSMEVKRLSNKSMSSIKKTFYWKVEEDIDELLNELRE